MRYFLFLMLYFFVAHGVFASIDYPYPEETNVYLKCDKNDSHLRGSLRIANPGMGVWLVQVWTEDENRNRYANAYPSLMRLDPKTSRVVSIYSEQVSKANKLKWLLVSFIPSHHKDERNKLVMPISYRLKVTTGS
ncbi:fimbria/pilus periplasmic chaperone [Escherichia coli]|uniref:fimbria/pilus periplasmic chaperone n=1 Tax=Escherichia coli TaxID=562 RepID=UPI000906F969|nr:fimbria/pilus periplasmic chaperone [Escherichia coli]EHX1165073.1 fimbria/pilus periplasmic chaperone [Escherichia coli]OKT91848.1 hypothetical protein ACN75_06735 [Escherichia coli]